MIININNYNTISTETAMSLLGDDGRGYELARKLEAAGTWRTWLGDSNYTNFAPFLSSPSAWNSFMSTDSSKSTLHIHLQLRVRALLFDKASSFTSLSSNPNHKPSLSKLNPNFLRLYPDDVYFTLDNNNAPSSSNSKIGSRYADSELPETWYNQVIENYKANKKLAMWDKELSPKRSPAEMASYIMCSSNYKKRRVVFQEEQHQVMDQSNGGNLVDGDDEFVFPEITYAWNCVPESAIPVSERVENNNNNQKMRIFSVLDTLPPVVTRSAEHVNGQRGGGLNRGKLGSEENGRVLGHEEAAKLSQKAVARILLGAGFEAAMEGPIEYLSDVMSKRIVKIGTNLKVLTDSYKKQCSAIELLKMLLKTEGFSNFAPLVDVVKDGSKNIVQQGQQRAHGIQSQLQQQQQNSLRRSYNESDLLSISNLAVPLSPYDDYFKDGEDGNERNSDIFGNHGFFLPDYSSKVVPIHNSFGHKTFLSTKRFPEHVKRPLNSLESCFMAQLYKAHAKMEEYVFSPLSSQSMATRSFHVSNGSRILNRESETLISALTGSKEHKLHKAGREKDKNVVRGVPSLPKTGSLNDTKKMKPDAVNGRSRRSSFSDDVFSGKLTGYDPTFIFSLGISLGIITCTMANKNEINKLRELLKQNENLVQDLHDELDMKDSMTVKELQNENYGSQDTCDHSFSGKELHEFSPEKHIDSSPRIDCEESYDKKEEQSSESMSKIEAELEAELERLGLDMNVSSLDRKLSELVEIDPEFVADFAQGELRADTVSGTDANVTTPLPANYAVSPHELSLRLHEVIKNQLEKRVKELEIALENSQRKVRFLESEHDARFEKATSPNKGNISMTHDEECDTMSQPLILNLSGEALDAYNEAYEELIKINDSEDNSPPTNIHDSDDNKEGSLSHDWNATVFEHGSATYSVVDEGSPSREPYFSKETMLELEEESSSDLNVSGDESVDCDNDEVERQLIRQIVERTKKGSPLFQNAKKILYSMGEDEQH